MAECITEKRKIEFSQVCCIERGSVADWFRALDYKNGGPLFKSSTVLLSHSGFVLSSPEFNSSTALCK